MERDEVRWWVRFVRWKRRVYPGRYRSVRNGLLERAKKRMMQYRSAASGIIPGDHALLTTIPAITPPSGSTPDAVEASGVWNSITLEADLTWTPSTNPKLDHYSIRIAPGP